MSCPYTRMPLEKSSPSLEPFLTWLGELTAIDRDRARDSRVWQEPSAEPVAPP